MRRRKGGSEVRKKLSRATQKEVRRGEETLGEDEEIGEEKVYLNNTEKWLLTETQYS